MLAYIGFVIFTAFFIASNYVLMKNARKHDKETTAYFALGVIYFMGAFSAFVTVPNTIAVLQQSLPSAIMFGELLVFSVYMFARGFLTRGPRMHQIGRISRPLPRLERPSGRSVFYTKLINAYTFVSVFLFILLFYTTR